MVAGPSEQQRKEAARVFLEYAERLLSSQDLKDVPGMARAGVLRELRLFASGGEAAQGDNQSHKGGC